MARNAVSSWSLRTVKDSSSILQGMIRGGVLREHEGVGRLIRLKEK